MRTKSKQRILVVEDEASIQRTLKRNLQAGGYEVFVADNGRLALEEARQQHPDLILLDIVMPGMDGYAVCQRLRADTATRLLPVVMITASSEAEKVKAIEAGADDFISKPINQPELFARVRSLLRIKALQDEVRRQSDALKEWNVKLEDRVRELNRLLDAGDRPAGAGIRRELGAVAAATGLFAEVPAAFLESARRRGQERTGLSVADIEAAIAARNDARRRKDFREADAIRERLHEQDILLEDTPSGTMWKAG